MSKTKIFWGAFFLSLGFFYLLDLIPYYCHPYNLNLKLFPIIFILLGILLLKPRKFVSTIALILIAILLSSTVFSFNKYLQKEKRVHWFLFPKYYDDDYNYN